MSESLQPDPAHSESNAGSEIVTRGRGCVGSIASNGCGCFAFLAGAGLAVALFGAHLMSGWGARAIEEYIGQYVDGTVEVSGVDLAWSEPQFARSVTILSPEGRQVLQARLKLPSILEMIGSDDGQRTYVVQILSMQSRVDADGTSDLGRTFKLVAGDGRTVVQAMRDRITEFLSKVRRDVAQSSLRVELVINDGRIDDSASGRGTVDIEEFRLVATASRIDAHFDLRECVLGGSELAGRTEAKFDVRFAFDDEDRMRLTQADVIAPPIPTSVLRTLGIVSRLDAEPPPPDPRRRRDVYDFGAKRGFELVSAALAQGASLKAYFGRPEVGSDPLLAIEMSGEYGDFAFDAAWRDGALVPVELVDGRAPFFARFRLAEGRLAELFESLAPESVVVTDRQPDVEWTLESRAFRLPLDPSQLVVSDSERDVEFTRDLAAWLRRAEITADLRNAGGSAAGLQFDAGEGGDEGWDVLDWSHRVSTLDLRGEFGGSVQSVWRTRQAPGGYAILELGLPGRSFGPMDDPFARLDISIPAMTTALLQAAAPLPEALAVLLPNRLYRLDVRGLPISRFIGGPRDDRMLVGVDVWTDTDLRFRGRYEDGEFRVPSESFEITITPEVCDALLERVLPWLEEVEPLVEGSKMRITMKDFAFSPGTGEFRESGEAKIETAPLRVKLRPSLASRFVIDSPDGWIEWTPGPIELMLEPNMVRYHKVELPLGDDVDPSKMSGDFDRHTGELELTGLVDSSSLPDPEDEGLLPVEVKIAGPLDGLRLFVDRDYVRKALESLRDKVVPGGGE